MPGLSPPTTLVLRTLVRLTFSLLLSLLQSSGDAVRRGVRLGRDLVAGTPLRAEMVAVGVHFRGLEPECGCAGAEDEPDEAGGVSAASAGGQVVVMRVHGE